MSNSNPAQTGVPAYQHNTATWPNGTSSSSHIAPSLSVCSRGHRATPSRTSTWRSLASLHHQYGPVECCRAVGGLLSAHAATTSQPGLVPGYAGGFLERARALADRLLPAFDTPTGIPLSWVSLTRGRLPNTVRDTCLACATTLTLEFRLLSHLTGDRRYGAAVDAAVAAVYSLRHPSTGLLGNTLSTDSGRWDRGDAGVGPGADSFYEYLLKTYLVLGDEAYLRRFAEQYVRVQRYMAVPGTWKGASWLLDVNMGTLEAVKQWVSSLSAFWPGVQVRCSRDVRSACCA